MSIKLITVISTGGVMMPKLNTVEKHLKTPKRLSEVSRYAKDRHFFD